MSGYRIGGRRADGREAADTRLSDGSRSFCAKLPRVFRSCCTLQKPAPFAEILNCDRKGTVGEGKPSQLCEKGLEIA